MDKYYERLQLGGKLHLSTDLACHLLRTFWDVQKIRKKCAAVIFVDLVSAFYTTLRELVMHFDRSDEQIASMMKTLGLPSDVMADLAANLAGPTAFEDAGVDDHLQALLAECHNSTWFAIDGLSNITCTKRGTRAGDILADAIFGFAAARVLKQITEKLAKADIYDYFDWNGATSVLEADSPPIQQVRLEQVTWIDDIMLPFSAASLEALIDKTKIVAQIFVDSMMEHGLKVNLKETKTEAIIAFRGCTSQQWQRWLHIEEDGKINSIQNISASFNSV